MGRFLRITFLIVFMLLRHVASSQHVVISEVYGGGGNSGATYKNDFIELYNPTPSPVSLSGWSVQYTSATGSSWGSNKIDLTGTLPPGAYYLIQGAAGTGGTVNLPTPDVSGSINLSGTAGKVALVSSTTGLSGTNPTGGSLVDLVGFGATANGYEGAGPTSAPSNTLSVERKIPCSDTDSNVNDFKTATPNPQNSSEIISAASFTSSYPKIQSVTSSGFQVITNLDKIGITYYVIVAAGATPPTSAQVKAGLDGDGNLLASDFKGSISVTSVTAEFTATVATLSSSTDYDVYVVTERCVLQPAPAKVRVTTLSSIDTTPPLYTSGYPKIQNVSGTGFRLVSNLNESGKTYFVILHNGDAAPSPDQVKAGQDAAGLSLSGNLHGEINIGNPNSDFTFDVTNISSATDYSVYFVSEDSGSNLQNSVEKIDVSTPILFTESFNDCNGTASFSSFSITGDQVWGCVDFGYNATKGLRMNGFGSAAAENEDWLISPSLNLSAGASLSFYSQFSFAGNALQLKVSTDYSGTGNPASATWTDLNGNFPTVAIGSSSVVLSDWTMSQVDLSAYANQKVYLAFVYNSTNSAAARWTLDEINVNGGESSYLSVGPSALTFNTAGEVKSYTLKGVNLMNDVSITASSDFTISKNNTVFGNSLSFIATEANANPTVYVKFNGTGISTFTGTITHTSTGAATRTVSLSAVDKSKTLNVTAYNLEFFGSNVADGSGEYGPVDDALQVSNVTTVLKTIGSDIFSVEEVSDDASMDQLLSGLPGYSKIMADRWSYSFNPPDPTFPPQKIGFIYNTATVQIVNSRVMFAKLYDDVRAAEAVNLNAALALLPNYPSSGGNTPSNFWSSGRLPFMITADVTVNAIKKRIKFIVIHSKSGSAAADYERRKYDVQVLHDSLVARYSNDAIMIMGDFNDDVDASINTGAASSYKMFVDDVSDFNVLTYALSQTGASSFPSSNSFLDHIIVSNELSGDYVNNSILVEDPRTYISGYTSNTSDHLPVSARFTLSKAAQTITFTAPATKTLGDAAFGLVATSTSNLMVSFSTASDKVTLAGSQVTIVKAGSVTITATQPGNESFNAATSMNLTFCINPAKPTITLSNVNTESPTLTSSSASGNQWYLNGIAITGATSPTYTAATPGIYKVQVKADNCLSAFSSDTPLIVTGDSKQHGRSEIAVYPNPVDDYLMISGLPEETAECVVTDMKGRASPLKLERQNGNHRADVRNYGAGLYLVRVQASNEIHQIKFIKK